MWYSIINQSTNFVQISQNYMLQSIICFLSYSRFHSVFSWIERLQPHKTNSGKFSFSFILLKIFSNFPSMSTSVRSVAQSCVTRCNLIDCIMPSFPIHHPTLRTCSNSCSSSWWYHSTISSSVVTFSSCLQSFPTSGSFLFLFLFLLLLLFF